MGQYHHIHNLDKHEKIHPHALGDGLKLLEFGCSGDGTMTALAILLAGSCKGGARGGGDVDSSHLMAQYIIGRWAGDRIAIIGDYAEGGDVPGMTAEHLHYAYENDVDISSFVRQVMQAANIDVRESWSNSRSNDFVIYDAEHDVFIDTRNRKGSDLNEQTR